MRDNFFALKAFSIGLFCKSEAVLENFGISDINIETARIFDIYKKLGAKIEISEDKTRVESVPEDSKTPLRIDLDFIDENTGGLFAYTLLQKRETIFYFHSQEVYRYYARLKPYMKKFGIGAVFNDNEFTLLLKPSMVYGAEIKLSAPDELVKNFVLLTFLFARGKSVFSEDGPGNDTLERILEYQKFSCEVKRSSFSQSVEDDPEENDELAKRIRKIEKKKSLTESQGKTPKTVIVYGGEIPAFKTVSVPGDLNYAAHLVVLSIILKNSGITVEGVNINSTRSRIVSILKRMGADISFKNRSVAGGALTADIVSSTSRLKGRKIGGEDSAFIVNEIPLVSIAASFAEGETVIRNAEGLRNNNPDLISATVFNLRNMDVSTGEIEDGIVLRGKKDYDGSEFFCRNSGPLSTAFFAAACCCRGKSVLKDVKNENIEYSSLIKSVNGRKTRA
ncbi:MAG: hypothetical protein ACLFQK_00085 [Fibrobacterota bacterium]